MQGKIKYAIRIDYIAGAIEPTDEKEATFTFDTLTQARAAIKLVEITTTERPLPLGIEELAAVSH